MAGLAPVCDLRILRALKLGIPIDVLDACRAGPDAKPIATLAGSDVVDDDIETHVGLLAALVVEFPQSVVVCGIIANALMVLDNEHRRMLSKTTAGKPQR
eukprot:14643749-Alexandrium_andersonii.AAC.1